jgi:hypothetical protein
MPQASAIAARVKPCQLSFSHGGATLGRMSANSVTDLSDMAGSWRLESNIVTFLDTGESFHQHGPNAIGWMVLDPSGRVMFLFGKADRPPPANDADCAALYGSIVGYTGRVRLDGPGRFVTSIDFSVQPNLKGEQVRFFSLQGDKLSIRSPEQTVPSFGDRALVINIVWIRES